jgi:hypothetical protein
MQQFIIADYQARLSGLYWMNILYWAKLELFYWLVVFWSRASHPLFTPWFPLPCDSIKFNILLPEKFVLCSGLADYEYIEEPRAEGPLLAKYSHAITILLANILLISRLAPQNSTSRLPLPNGKMYGVS